MGLTLTEVQNLLAKENLLREFITPDTWTLEAPMQHIFRHLSYNSKDVDVETLFFCKGNHFKKSYLEDALAHGLQIYIAEKDYEVAAPLAIIVTDIRKALAVLSMAFYDYPQENLTLIGITGTKGKTTVAYFTKEILAESTGQKTALLSTMNTTLDGETYFKSALTTPESLDLYRMMDEAVKNGMTHLIMEVSSQAYKVDRVYGLTFDLGVFLNISPDHIGPIEHPTFEDYFYCKRQLVNHSKQVIVYREMDHFNLIAEMAKQNNIPLITYGGQDADYQVTPTDSLHFKLTSSDDQLKLDGTYEIKHAGDFNKNNGAAAAITASLVGANQTAIQSGLKKALVPGRMNLLLKPNGAHIYIDYAHNYLSMQAILAFAKKDHGGKVIVVTGSAGGKAESRREDIGKAIGELADVVYLTSDDPDHEDPKAIANQILRGINQTLYRRDLTINYEFDRSQAIVQAVKAAEIDDAVIIAGKGTEIFLTIAGNKQPYEGDYQIVERILREQ